MSQLELSPFDVYCPLTWRQKFKLYYMAPSAVTLRRIPQTISVVLCVEGQCRYGSVLFCSKASPWCTALRYTMASAQNATCQALNSVAQKRIRRSQN